VNLTEHLTDTVSTYHGRLSHHLML